MAKTTTLENVKTKMKELREARQSQFDKIRQMQETYRAQIRDADLTMKQATAALDLDTYDAARQAKRKSEAGLEMYDKRQKELEAQEIISEPESDAIIDDLLAFEGQLADAFRQAIEEPIRQLSHLYEGYIDAVEDTERTLREWELNVHANYVSRNGMSRIDPATGQRTNRSETPLPVHRLPYLGCPEAQRLEAYLKKENEVL